MTTETAVNNVFPYLETIPIPLTTGSCPYIFEAAGKFIECKDLSFSVRGIGTEQTITGKILRAYWIYSPMLKVVIVYVGSGCPEQIHYVGIYDPRHRRASFCKGAELHPGLLPYHIWWHGYTPDGTKMLKSSESFQYALRWCKEEASICSPTGLIDLLFRMTKPEWLEWVWDDIGRDMNIAWQLHWEGIIRLLTYTAMQHKDLLELPWDLSTMPSNFCGLVTPPGMTLISSHQSPSDWQDTARCYAEVASKLVPAHG